MKMLTATRGEQEYYAPDPTSLELLIDRKHYMRRPDGLLVPGYVRRNGKFEPVIAGAGWDLANSGGVGVIALAGNPDDVYSVYWNVTIGQWQAHNNRTGNIDFSGTNTRIVLQQTINATQAVAPTGGGIGIGAQFTVGNQANALTPQLDGPVRGGDGIWMHAESYGKRGQAGHPDTGFVIQAATAAGNGAAAAFTRQIPFGSAFGAVEAAASAPANTAAFPNGNGSVMFDFRGGDNKAATAGNSGGFENWVMEGIALDANNVAEICLNGVGKGTGNAAIVFGCHFVGAKTACWRVGANIDKGGSADTYASHTMCAQNSTNGGSQGTITNIAASAGSTYTVTAAGLGNNVRVGQSVNVKNCTNDAFNNIAIVAVVNSANSVDLDYGQAGIGVGVDGKVFLECALAEFNIGDVTALYNNFAAPNGVAFAFDVDTSNTGCWLGFTHAGGGGTHYSRGLVRSGRLVLSVCYIDNIQADSDTSNCGVVWKTCTGASLNNQVVDTFFNQNGFCYAVTVTSSSLGPFTGLTIRNCFAPGYYKALGVLTANMTNVVLTASVNETGGGSLGLLDIQMGASAPQVIAITTAAVTEAILVTSETARGGNPSVLTIPATGRAQRGSAAAAHNIGDVVTGIAPGFLKLDGISGKSVSIDGCSGRDIAWLWQGVNAGAVDGLPWGNKFLGPAGDTGALKGLGTTVVRFAANGDGVTKVFNVAHGCYLPPDWQTGFGAGHLDASEHVAITHDATNTILTYALAPAAGAGNVKGTLLVGVGLS